ncbi:UNVERIFIED_CONTAM: hypothetical protein JM85_2471 [Acetobacter peroxydans]
MPLPNVGVIPDRFSTTVPNPIDRLESGANIRHIQGHSFATGAPDVGRLAECETR